MVFKKILDFLFQNTIYLLCGTNYPYLGGHKMNTYSSLAIFLFFVISVQAMKVSTITIGSCKSDFYSFVTTIKSQYQTGMKVKKVRDGWCPPFFKQVIDGAVSLGAKTFGHLGEVNLEDLNFLVRFFDNKNEGIRQQYFKQFGTKEDETYVQDIFEQLQKNSSWKYFTDLLHNKTINSLKQKESTTHLQMLTIVNQKTETGYLIADEDYFPCVLRNLFATYRYEKSAK